MKQLSIFVFTLAFAVSASAALSSTDRKTMLKLGQGDSSEVDLAKLVVPKATNEEVKDFAQRMISDHGKSFDRLDEIARAEKVTLKGGMDAEHKKFAKQLSKKKLGAAYDRTYMKQMVEDHKKDKSGLEKAIRKTKNLELKAWEGKELDTVKEHLKMAEDIRAQLK